jgi:aminoglycoside/choline kinase family phosphotransferase
MSSTDQPASSEVIMNELREQELGRWTAEMLRQRQPEISEKISLSIVSGDASFRRYFRAQLRDTSFIVVDAPPDNEDSGAFVRISGILREAGVLAPSVLAVDFSRGFMLLEDFGDELYLPHLLKSQAQESSTVADDLYQAAIKSLLTLQRNVDIKQLKPYDRQELRREMALFDEWFCGALLNLQLTESERDVLAKVYTFLEDAALSQTEVAVHRDYHSRNLLLLDADIYGANSGPGIIDFQDAVSGAYSYDLVSLLRDCYIRWQPQQVRKWALDYHKEAIRLGVLTDFPVARLYRDMDLMGLQRQFKVMGVFARLHIRDNKPQFLADIPLVIEYFLEVSSQYPEMAAFLSWFKVRVLPLARIKLNLES